MKPPGPVVVFADIGEAFQVGDLLQGSAGARESLCSEDVVLVLCSNMTRAQLEICQQQLGIAHPFICESGAALLVPHGYFPFGMLCDRDHGRHHVFEFGTPYAEVVDVLHRTAARLGIGVVGFSDMSVEQVAIECDLSLSQARLAKLREYDEPFRLVEANDAARNRLLKALRAARMVRTHRGAYDYVGAPVDKGTSVGLLTALYRRAFGPIITVGVGDATNSMALLRRVKMPYVVEQKGTDPKSPSLPWIPKLDLPSGSTAWIEAIADVARQARDRRKTLRRAG
jgi:predicted mannosyl-3-phosphoglycerate phosphatase (HAD superfamily)